MLGDSNTKACESALEGEELGNMGHFLNPERWLCDQHKQTSQQTNNPSAAFPTLLLSLLVCHFSCFHSAVIRKNWSLHIPIPEVEQVTAFQGERHVQSWEHRSSPIQGCSLRPPPTQLGFTCRDEPVCPARVRQ